MAELLRVWEGRGAIGVFGKRIAMDAKEIGDGIARVSGSRVPPLAERRARCLGFSGATGARSKNIVFRLFSVWLLFRIADDDDDDV